MIRAILDRAFARTAFTPVPGTEEDRPFFRDGRLRVPPVLLRRAAAEGFRELSFYMRRSHLELLAALGANREASSNDRLAAAVLLENAAVAAEGEFALCQDTGTAIVYGWKDESVFTGADDQEELEEGIAGAYRRHHLRASQTGASSFFEEFNTGNNLPAQIHLSALRDGPEGPRYRFLFIAKGGGASNRTALFSMTKAFLEEGPFAAFLEEKIRALGTAACPPYRLAVVVGGSSPEFNLEILKLATTELLDGAPFSGEGEPGTYQSHWIFRDRYWEARALELGRQSGLGAQFGGTGLLLDARVLRLPRHAASCPVSIGVSCAAHRNLLASIDRRGLMLETLVRNPGELLSPPGAGERLLGEEAGKTPEAPSRILLDRPLEAVRRELSLRRPGDRLLLSGKLLVARDAAHLRWRQLLARGEELPDYLRRYPVYYAGPAETPPGKVTGSLGPTTAQRMDPYGEELMSRGAGLVTLAKGNRSAGWKDACKKYGGFYLGTIGGAAALQAGRHVTASELLDYQDLGMEAVRLITVRDLLAFLVIDSQGNSLY
jgi:fumarate hydratase class I